MKLFTTLSFSILYFASIAQQFQIESTPQTIYSNYKGTPLQAVITSSNQLIYGKDEIEIVDIVTGKVIKNWDPKGVYGYSYISNDGKWIANQSQNYKDPQLGNVDVYQVLNTETNQEYFRTVPDELWATTGFANHKNEVAIQTYNSQSTTNKVRLIRYDYISGEEISTLFSTEKSSTVILDIEYSTDDKVVFATIATNASVSTFYAFDASTGKVLGKTPLSHQSDRIFVKGDKIILSGVHGINTTEYITILSAKDYSKTKEWKGKYAYNIDPTGKYTITYNWETESLYVFDIETGKESLLLEAKGLNLYPLASAFNTDGNYFAITRKNSFEYYKTRQPGEYEKAYILDNSLIENPALTTPAVAETEESNNSSVTETTVNTPSWVSYAHATPKFEVKLPGEAKVKEEKNEKGNNTLTVTGASKTEASIISAIEIPGVKSKKYATLSQKMGEEFIKKKTPTEVKKSDYQYQNQEGVEYTFRIDKFEYVYRSFCKDGYAYQLIYLAPQLDAEEYNKFFDSFILE